jgi:hypothetical protein
MIEVSSCGALVKQLNKIFFKNFYFINDRLEFFIKNHPIEPACLQSKVGPNHFTNPKVGPPIKNYGSDAIVRPKRDVWAHQKNRYK